MSKRIIPLVALAILAASCSSASEVATPDEASTSAAVDETSTNSGPPASFDLADLPRGEVVDFGPAPAVPGGDLAPETAAALDTLFGNGTVADIFSDQQVAALISLGDSEDPRVAWILLDLIRFAQEPAQAQRLTDASNKLLGGGLAFNTVWGVATDRLIAWDIPEPPGYVDIKRTIYSSVLPQWEPLFADPSTNMDWRYVSWGGVAIDDRPFDTTDDPCNCIPAADNPETQPAAEATWIDDDDVVFGVVIDGEARAYPRQIMEVREMVNDTLGGRDFAMPYCTLCGAAQVWFTDDVPEGVQRPVLRTRDCSADRTRSCTTSTRSRSSTRFLAPPRPVLSPRLVFSSSSMLW